VGFRTGRKPTVANVPVKHPGLIKHEEERAKSLQNRVADSVTGLAGSMSFVYLHIIFFAAWMLIFEDRPWQTLTLLVSLEAIFLSTFVMISQNRADARRQVQANETWENVQKVIESQNRILAEIAELRQEDES
jgi:uncharacterized membrane protein